MLNSRKWVTIGKQQENGLRNTKRFASVRFERKDKADEHGRPGNLPKKLLPKTRGRGNNTQEVDR